MERKHQKDIENTASENSDAPRVIKSLRDEILLLKTKSKQNAAQNTDNLRIIKQSDEERGRLREQNIRLEALVASKNLADRESLKNLLDQEILTNAEAARVSSDIVKKCELSERNLFADNRHMRVKVIAMEKDYVLSRDKLKAMEEIISQKDKIIASLSIYKHHATHRKIKKEEPCKICIQRTEENVEAERKLRIISRIPQIDDYTLIITSETSLNCIIDTSNYSNAENFEFTSINLQYAEEESMSTVNSETIQYMQGVNSYCIPIAALGTGKMYYFRLKTIYKEFAGTSSVQKSQLVDKIPNPLTILDTTVESSVISIHLEPLADMGSPITSFSLIYSNDPSFENHQVILLEPKEIRDCTYKFSAEKIGVPYFFKIRASNIMGTSFPSNASKSTLIGIKVHLF